MPNYIAIREGKSIKKYNLGKATLPMTIIRKHLFRTDLRLFHEIVGTDECIMFTELESTQAYGNGRDFVDPDDTIAFLDTAPTGKNSSVGFLGSFSANPMMFVYAAIGVVIIATMIGGWLK